MMITALTLTLSGFGGFGDAAETSGKINRVYIVPLSHLDIGFTASPREVAEHYRSDLEIALRVANNLPDARWNIESIWQLEQWLKAAPEDERTAFLKEVMSTQRLGISASYASMHSALMTGEEMLRMLYPGQKLAEKIGIPLETAVMNDVPGFAWYMPQALRASGIKRLIVGVNLDFGGGTSIPPHMIPFYWAGPDGSSVLTWISPKGYLEGGFHWELHNPETFQKRLEALEASGYPYDAILIIDGYGDNASVDRLLSRLNDIRRLRATLPGVEIIYGTIDEYFDYMEEKYGRVFPTFSGDWGRTWDVGRISGPWQMAEYRALQRLMPAAEALATLAYAFAGAPYPAERLAQGWNLLNLVSEHTGGPGTGWPDLTTAQQVDESNVTVLSYVRSAREIVEEVAAASFAALAGTADSADESSSRDVLVYNALSWPRTGLVALRAADLPPAAGYRVIDPATGAELASMWDGDTFVLETPEMPPMALARYRLEPVEEVTENGEAAKPADLETRQPGATVILENEWYRIEIDPDSGWVLSMYDKERSREIVNRASRYRFNQMLWASHHVDFIGGTPTPIVPAVASIERVESPFASGITIRYAEGTPWHETTILLPRARARVEIHNIIDRGKMRKVPYDEHSDHFYFAFPLALSTRQLSANYLGATRFQSLKDVLPGANANGIVSLGAVDLRDALWGVTVAHREAFSFSVGGIGQSSALFQPVEATLFAHVVQKADEGKTKDKGITAFEVEPGAPNLLRFAFAFEVSDGEFDPVAASRFALEYVMSPLAWVGAPAGSSAATSLDEALQPLTGRSLVAVDQPNVLVTALKKAEATGDPKSKAVIVRLQEIAGVESEVRLETALPAHAAVLTDAVERVLSGPIPSEIAPASDQAPATARFTGLTLKPYETLTLKLELSGS